MKYNFTGKKGKHKQKKIKTILFLLIRSKKLVHCFSTVTTNGEFLYSISTLNSDIEEFILLLINKAQ